MVAYSQEVDTLDPHQFKTDAGYGVVGNIYGTLLQEKYTDGGAGVLEYAGESAPYLAESATWDDSQTTLTFVLKDGLEFANGDPVTAEDAAWSIQRALSDVGYVQAIAQWLNITDPATDIVATDDKTLEFHVTHYSPLIEQFLAFQIFAILDKSALEDEMTADDPWAAKYLAGEATASGPYVVESTVPGKSMTLAKNETFTGQRHHRCAREGRGAGDAGPAAGVPGPAERRRRRRLRPDAGHRRGAREGRRPQALRPGVQPGQLRRLQQPGPGAARTSGSDRRCPT